MNNLLWIEKDGKPVPATSEEFGVWFERQDRQVARNRVNGRLVSTVFLGIDHSFRGDVPILYETMIFCDNQDELHQFQRRYATREEALIGHAEAMAMANKHPANLFVVELSNLYQKIRRRLLRY